MELWWRIRGWVRLRLTSADCAGRLREISREIRLEDIRFPNDLTAEFSVLRRDQERVHVHDGDQLEIVGAGGLRELFAKVKQWKLLAVTVLLLGFLTAFFQGRMLFLTVEGNGDVPARLILERAEECGVYFGAPARELRSEQVKNHLLWAIPELRWAGVNVNGCNVVITVAQRQEADVPREQIPGDIVASIDGVVTDVFPGTGSVLASPGQAVREGQVLICGETDLGLLVRQDQADGEVYGLTMRLVEAALPEKTLQRQRSDRVIRKFSLLIGKKYVNFSNDSGILHGTCVKMRTVHYLKLPGGFQLPAALVTETYRLCETEPVSREMDAQLLLDAARRVAREQMTAGTILRENVSVVEGRLRAVLECREMIGVFRPAIETEGDTNDREIRERGAG